MKRILASVFILLLILLPYNKIARFLFPSLLVQQEIRQANPDECSADFPLFIRIENKSRKAITLMRVHSVLSIPGRSTKYISDSTIDDIIEPGQTYITCRSYGRQYLIDTTLNEYASWNSQMKVIKGDVSIAF